MSPIDTKVEQTPVESPLVSPVEKQQKTIQDVSADLEKFKKEKLADIESLKDIAEDKKEEKRKNILLAIADKQKEIEDLQQNFTTQQDLDALKKMILDFAELKQKVEDSKKTGFEKFTAQVGDKFTKAVDYAKEHPWKTAWIGALIVGGWILIHKIFSSDDKKEDTNNGKKSWTDKVWDWFKWVAAWTWIYTVIDRFMTGKWRWEKKADGGVGDGLSDIENVNKAFEKLDSKEKEKYNTYGAAVNDFYTDVYTFSDGTVPVGMNDVILWSTDKKLDATAWIIPFMLDGTFGSIADMNSETWLFSLDVNADAHEIAKKLAWMVGNGAGKMAKWILDTIWFEWVIDPANIETQVVDFLTGSNKIDDTKLIFRKILKVISFNNYAENVFINQEVQKLLATGKTLYKKWKPARDDEEQWWEVKNYDKTDTDLIKDIVSHPENYKVDDTELGSLKTEVRSHTIAELSAKVGGITKDKIWSANLELKENIDDINSKRDQKHKDLEKDKNGTLDKMKNDAEDQLAGSLRSRMQKGMPLFHLIDFGWAANWTKESLKKHAGFQKLLSQFTWEFEKLKSESDLSVVKNKIDMYYATIKEIWVAEFAIDEIADENGNIGARIGMKAKNLFFGALENIEYGFVLFSDGYMLEWSMYMLSWALPFYLLGTTSGRKVLMKTGSTIVSTTMRASIATISTVSGRLSLSTGKNVAQVLANNELGRLILRNGMFRWEAGKNLFKYYYLTGWLSTNAANILVSDAKREWRASDVFQYLKDLKVIRADEDVRVLQKGFGEGRDYIANKSIRELLFKTTDAGIWNKIFSPQSIPVDANVPAFEQLHKFEEKCSTVGVKTKDFLHDFVKNWSISNIDELKNVVANIDKIDEAKLVGKNADQLAKIFDDMRTAIKTASFVGVVERVRPTSEIADIARVKTKLDDALKLEWDRLIKLNKRAKQWSATKLNIAITEANIKKLESLVSNLDTMEPKQILLFEHVLANTVDTVKAVKILEVLWSSPEGAKAAEKLFAWNIDEFVAIMQSTGLLKKAGIADDVLQWFAKWLKFASHMDEALDMAKSVVKILSKVH
jgi:hypothetical protein